MQKKCLQHKALQVAQREKTQYNAEKRKNTRFNAETLNLQTKQTPNQKSNLKHKEQNQARTPIICFTFPNQDVLGGKEKLHIN
jgi:hypothetical protein